MVSIVVHRTGCVVLPTPLFKDAVADTPVREITGPFATVTEFNNALACSPATVEVGEKTRNPENGAPEKGANPSMAVLKTRGGETHPHA